MKSIAVFPKEKKVGSIQQPAPGPLGDYEVKLKILEVGICGTDREIAAFEYGAPPEGSDHLVLGHEALAEVIETGKQVDSLKAGDLVVPLVRRPCNDRHCWACRSERQDFCTTGKFSERGIKESDGFLSEFSVEDETFLVRVPEKLREVGVLIEPLSIATKAWEQAFAVQSRLPYPQRKRQGFVLGAGPVGLLGAMVLRVHGYDAFIYSREAATGERADLIRSFGATYISAQDCPLHQIKEKYGAMNAIYEAVGITSVAFDALDTLAANGVCVLTGIPGVSDSTSVEMSRIMRNIVLKNQLIFGTVNAGVEAFESAVAHLEQFMFLFPDAVRKLILRHPMSEATELIQGKKGIKDIIRIAA